MHFHRPFFVALCLLCAFLTSVRAEMPSQVPNPLRTRRSWVADEAGVIDAATEAKINRLISRLERRNGAEIAVVTVHNLGGLKVEDFALRLFKLWGIGKKTRNNGVLVLAAIDDRKARITIGYGLESRISDTKAVSILQSDILSAFRRDDYSGGLLAGVVSLDRIISAPAPSKPPKAAAKSGIAAPFSPSISTPNSSSAAPVADAYRSETSTSTSRFGGGALWLLLLGGGGGVGAIVYFASRPRRCAGCQGVMEELSAEKATQALTPVQQFEEGLGSRDYHLWRCTKCGDQLVDVSNRLFSSYGDCRACGNRTAASHTETEVHATQHHAGRAIETHTCQWPQCGHIWQEERILPRLSSSSHRHSSSGSSSSKSGFGGGSSGGSGASGSW